MSFFFVGRRIQRLTKYATGLQVMAREQPAKQVLGHGHSTREHWTAYIVQRRCHGPLSQPGLPYSTRDGIFRAWSQDEKAKEERGNRRAG